MDESTKDTIRQAIQLLREGNGKAAAPLLAEVLKKEPELEQAWYLLGLAVEDETRKKRAFNRVLQLNPNHEKARAQLDKLELPPPEEPDFHPEVVEPVTEEPEPTPPETGSDPFKIEDFELPEWMQQDSFNPEDYTTGSLELPSEPIFDIEEDEEEAEQPTWAQEKPPEPFTFDDDMDLDMSTWSEPEGDSFTVQEVEAESLPWESETEPEEDATFDEPEESPASYLDQLEEEDQPYKRAPAFFEDDDADEFYYEKTTEEPDWLREMVDEREDEKESKKVSRITLTPDQKRQRRRRVLNIILVLAVIGLGYAGYYFREEWQPYIEPYIPPVMTRAAPITYLLTERAPITYLLTPNFYLTATPTNTPPVQPTTEPTWTPQGGAGAVLPPGGGSGTDPNATPATTPTPIPLDAGIVAEMEGIEEQVSSVRNLPGPANLDRELVSLTTLKQVLELRMLDEAYLEKLANDEIVLRTFGFINGNYDLTLAAINNRVDPLGGYYDFEQDKIYVVGTEFRGQEKYIYAHQVAHAIQDTNFGYSRLDIYPTCNRPAQACLAIHALAEGGAALLETLWFALYPQDIDSEDFLNQEPGPLFPEGPIPTYYLKHIEFAHTYGREFVTAAYEDGDWVGVNRLYGFLPTTTEQILHPEKYQRGELGAAMGHPNLAPIFEQGWELAGRGTLGEWDSYLLLAYNDYPKAARPDEEAATAASGWGGDEYQIYYNADTGGTFLSAYSFWDTRDDADEFRQSLTSYVNTRMFSANVDGPGDGLCWFHLQQMSCIYQNDRYILWLLSDEVELIEDALARFSRFR